MTPPTLSDADLIHLWQNYNDHSARNQLTLRHTYLIYRILPNYEKVGVPRDDLIQEGWDGLQKAANDVNLSKGTFQTRASFWIRECMRLCVFRQKPVVHKPYGLQRRIHQLKKVKEQFLAASERNPSSEDLASKLKLTPTQVDKAIRADRFQPNGDVEQITSTSKVDKEKIWAILDEMHPNQRELLVRHYGIDNEEPEDLDKIGKRLGMRPKLLDRAWRNARENFRIAYEDLAII